MRLDDNELSGAVALVGAGPGDPELLTLRAAKLLRCADVVLYDHLTDPALLEHCRASVRLVFVGKIPDGPRTPQTQINKQLVMHALTGAFVVRLKGGDPFVFGRGGEESIYLKKKGVRHEIVPGISSCISVPGSAGIPVTHRGVSTHFSVITGFGAVSGEDLEESWRRLGAAGGTLVFLMGVRRLSNIVRVLIESGRSAETPAALIHAGTTPNQRTVQGTLATIEALAKAAKMTTPATFIVGDVVALRDQMHDQIALDIAPTLQPQVTYTPRSARG